MWGSLRLAPIIQKIYSKLVLCEARSGSPQLKCEALQQQQQQRFLPPLSKC